MAKLTVYEQLLKLYPGPYRNKYGPQMTQMLADMLDDTTSSALRKVVWLHVAADLPASIVKAQLNYVGGIMQNEIPKYVKQSGLVAALCIIPFFLALIANVLSGVIYGHDLYNSWLWSAPVLTVWIVVLPCLALFVAGGAYFWSAVQGHARSKAALARRLFDIPHLWMLMVPMILAVGILCVLLFHDSVHCWTGNPVRELRNFHQTWQCTIRGFLGGK